MKYSRILWIFGILILAGSTFGQKMLEKPHASWGKEETLRLYRDSAWAKPYQAGAAAAAAGQVAREQRQSVNSGGSDPKSVARNFGPPPVTLRLHSALPMRKAIVRMRQIDAGYDKMSDADKAAFDASQKKFLDCAICKEYYVVTLTKDPDSSGATVEEGIFQGMTFEQLKGNVKLVNDKGEERELSQFNAPKGAQDMTVFYFKRTNDAGDPLFTPESKDLKFVFRSDFLDSKNRFAYLLPRTFEFKVSKMIFGEELLF